MSELLREVDEALRQERAMKFWKENAAYIVFFVVGTIALTGGLSAYKSWKASENEKQTAQLMALEEAKDYPDNILAAAPALQTLNPDLRGIALLKAAGAALAKKQTDKAWALYEKTATDKSLPEDFHALATLMSVRLSSNKSDQKPEDLIAKLAPLWLSSDSLWAAHARLEAAIITAHKLHDMKKAREYLNTIRDSKDLPETLYQRAQALDHLYGLKNQKTADKT